jgi:cobalamin biosynthesis protein CbiD
MNKKRLRTGFTTGTAAAAAAKAALLAILEGQPPREVSVELLTGDRISIPAVRASAGSPSRGSSCRRGSLPSIPGRGE